MKQLQATTVAQDGHYHIVYTNTETGLLLMSPAKDGHTHEGMYDPPREPVPPFEGTPDQVDPLTGQMIPGEPPNPGDPGKEEGTWILRPAADGHTHELQEYVISSPKRDKEKDDQIIKDCLALWQESVSLTQDSRDKGVESEGFYSGKKQWRDIDKQALEANDRAALTLNEVMPNIDTLIGYQMEQRTDIKYLARGDGDQRASDLYNAVTKTILDNCGYQKQETKVFKNQCVPGMGVFQLFVTTEKDVRGEIKVKSFPWNRAWYGAHEEDDLSDCEYQILESMRSLANITKDYPDKAEEIERSYASYAGRFPDLNKKSGIDGKNNDYAYAVKVDDIPVTLNGVIPLVDVQRKQFRLVECTRVIYREVTVVFNEEENFFYTAYDWDKKDLALIRSIPGFFALSQMKKRFRITRFCGNVVLSDENPADLPENDFFTIPVYAYRQDGEFWGKVEIAKDPQRELNKRRSQLMDLMNRLGASVYYTTPETFLTAEEKSKFKRGRSKPGAMFEVSSLDLTPKLEEGAQLPPGVAAIMQLDQENLQRLMNIVVTQSGANEPGSLFLEKKKGMLTGNQFLFDNMSFAKQKLGYLLVKMIQRYYDVDRLQDLLNSSYSREKFKVGGVDFKDYSKDEIEQILNDANSLEFDVIVTESSFTASTRIEIAKMLFDLMSKGVLQTPDLALEFLDIPQDVRVRINENTMQQQQAQAEAATTAADAEITKTLVAKGNYTVSPEKAQSLGLIPANNGLPTANAPSNPELEQPENSFALNDALVSG